MDTNIGPTKGKKVYKTTWERDFIRLKELRESFLKLSNAHVYLPFGWIDLGNPIKPKKKLGRYTHKSIKPEFRPLIPKHFNAGMGLGTIGFMTAYAESVRERKILGLQMTFPASTGEHLIHRVTGFKYKWNKSSVTIKRILGTTKIPRVEEQILCLLRECNRFFNLYCEEKIVRI